MIKTNKSYDVVVSDRAAEMMMQHVRFMAQVSLEASDKIRLEIIDAANSLRNFPERNAWLIDPALPINKYHKMIINKRYLLIYQIKHDIVNIEYILDCRQDYRWLI